MVKYNLIYVIGNKNYYFSYLTDYDRILYTWDKTKAHIFDIPPTSFIDELYDKETHNKKSTKKYFLYKRKYRTKRKIVEA